MKNRTQMAVFLPVSSFIILLFLVALGLGASYSEPDTDRPGPWYRTFALDYKSCHGICNTTPGCQAWTFTKPGYRGPVAKCYLKNSRPSKTYDANCVSGLAGLSAVEEMDTDRNGSDYATVVFDEKYCEDWCNEDWECQAWTFVKPGTKAPDANCFFKRRAFPRSKDVDCVSGMKANIEGDLAAGDWCHTVDTAAKKITFYPIVWNVHYDPWAHNTESWVVIEATVNGQPNKETITLPAFPVWSLEAFSSSKLPSGLAVPFDVGNEYALKSLFEIGGNGDLHPDNNKYTVTTIGIKVKGSAFLPPDGLLYKKDCKFGW